MSSLNFYLQEVQRLIHDPRQTIINPDDLTFYINEARRQVAMRGSCLRLLTPISGSIMTATVTAGGSGYVSPVVTISPPDFPNGGIFFPNGAQATATATAPAGVITAVNITFGGSGYFQPQITISGSPGSGAIIKPNLSLFNQLNGGQEIYPFSGVDLSPFPGYGVIYMVRSVSLIYANYRYSLPMYSFSAYQAYIRQYPFQYQYIPTVGSQFGQGSNGSFYLYPLPSTNYQMEWDCQCLPQDLIDDQSVEALPWPWIDAVKYYAAYRAFLEIQNMNSARMHLELFEKFVKEYNVASRPGRAVNPYGRY